MNIGTIVTPNVKGQIVIPQWIRTSLGITAETPLQVIQAGQSVVLHPIVGIVRKSDLAGDAFMEILERTRGVWGPASREDVEREKRRKKRELAASRKRTNTW